MDIVKRKNQYQIAKKEGRLGSLRDSTWSKELHMHTCCKIKHPWYHKKDCPIILNKNKKIQLLSGLKEIVNEMKNTGMTSREVSEKLNIPMEKINAIWSCLIM